MISIDSLHGLLVSLAATLIAYVSGDALNVADTLDCGRCGDFDISEDSGVCLADLLPVLIYLFIAQACALGASIVLFVALVCQFAFAVGELLRDLGNSLDRGVCLSQVLELLSGHAHTVADTERVCGTI